VRVVKKRRKQFPPSYLYLSLSCFLLEFENFAILFVFVFFVVVVTTFIIIIVVVVEGIQHSLKAFYLVHHALSSLGIDMFFGHYQSIHGRLDRGIVVVGCIVIVVVVVALAATSRRIFFALLLLSSL
jgi:hypothetical protein